MFKFFGTCEYCDTEETVTHFPHLGINVCGLCVELHRDVLFPAEASY